jgi:predicted DNA-binding transcriptional regulator AlpA
MKLVGLSKSKIYALIAERAFPKQIRLAGGRAVAWPALEVEKWVREHLGDRGLESVEGSHSVGRAADEPKPKTGTPLVGRLRPFKFGPIIRLLNSVDTSKASKGS